MRHSLRKSYWVALALCCATLFSSKCVHGAAGPAESLRFEQLNVEQGLPQEPALAVLQDRQGFIWIGTVAGLSRYDGYTITVYKNSPDNPSSLSDNFVTSLYQDEQGRLWVGTKGALSEKTNEIAEN